MALFGQDAPDPRIAALGGVLGDIITGGPQSRGQLAYVDQFSRNAKAADAMWTARDSRARAIAREGITPEALADFQAGRNSALGANILATSASPDMRILGAYQLAGTAEMANARNAAVLGGDMVTANRLTNTLEGRATPLVEVNAQGIAYDPNVPLGDQVFRTTPMADADIDLTKARTADVAKRGDAYVVGQHARAAQSYAAAARYGAQSGVYNAQAAAGGFNPNTGSRGGKTVNIVSDAEKLMGMVPGVTITSTFRDAARNARVGGMPNSQHVSGTAFDIVAPTPEAYEQARAWGQMMGYDVIDERNRPGYKPHMHFELRNGARSSSTFVPGGANPTKAGVQPNTDTGVGLPTVLGGRTPEPRVPVSAADAGRKTKKIPAAAIRDLWADPSLEDEFAAKYGRAAARQAMADRR